MMSQNKIGTEASDDKADDEVNNEDEVHDSSQAIFGDEVSDNTANRDAQFVCDVVVAAIYLGCKDKEGSVLCVFVGL